ncbi:phosphate ABC transporter ATP-binding protein [candidate division WOR-1 bacterium RIFOXYB2_FULL_42_35]|uniref:Phosphate ABC transporter ATP-binding protein n=1 Tax=candidate division WOR-1 bacterium RIFOXYC2_FULL_41_25 TaxID=1802586 RepID=A0A1F4TQ85_UNCSA|nr:MAG: phosphate ABC transporter ATP-binding protein [candidate division WOR-1 bacterium RIFOXYA2_FULL_41_14]OGC25476.1 MAG: phosphate ABC transporter ATP-binding protein [candidate division WOR-1 bacterium RIFOXYB2_FULL_42_35]OGC34882.1 MAG: phosphate ABC transporter ATP-binding protein [candidate division WOR-1 bacterium RIFOXYC2_FULL_41_25]
MVSKLKVDSLNVFYDYCHVLKNVSLEVDANEILGIIGPANSGKTSFLKTLNRMNDFDHTFKMDGNIFLDNKNIFTNMQALALRKRIGMVFALPLSLPLSIFDNVAYGPRLHGQKNKTKLKEIVERGLKASYLWDEVKDRLDTPALNLSGGQQQRLCISRTLAVEPEVILYDEPCSGLDPISTAKVEEAMRQLRKNYTQILVTNNTKQSARVADRTAFFLMGELIEIGLTAKVFTQPDDKRTDDYISGRFG